MDWAGGRPDVTACGGTGRHGRRDGVAGCAGRPWVDWTPVSAADVTVYTPTERILALRIAFFMVGAIRWPSI